MVKIWTIKAKQRCLPVADGDVGGGGARLFVIFCCSPNTFWRWICSFLKNKFAHI